MIRLNKFNVKKIKYMVPYIIVTLASVACIFFALDDNMNVYLTPSNLLAKKDKDIINKNIRLGGVVKKGSVQKGKGLYISFVTTDFEKEIQVKYNGILPDLFREGQGIVIYGKYLDNGVFYAKEILTKHDEKYMPPNIEEA